MILEVKDGSKFETELFLDDQNVFELIDFKTKNELFSLALLRIDNEIATVAELTKENKEGLYLWCLTYDIHRADGIIGMVLDYYLLEIIKFLVSKYDDIKEIRFRKATSKSFETILKNELKIKVINRLPIKQKLKVYLRYKLGPLKSIFKTLKSSLKHPFKGVKVLPNETVLILKPIYKPYNRLKGFPDVLNQKHSNVYILDPRLFIVKNYTTDEEVTINPYNATLFIRALKETITFSSYKKSFIKEYKTSIGGYGIYLKHQSFLQSYFVKLKKLAYLEVFKQLKPVCLVVSSTFGDPQKRMPLITAKWQDVKTILFSCRPFITSMRSEDRLITPDLLQYHNSTIGDEILVFDKPSFNHLIQSGIRKERIGFYVPNQTPIQNSETIAYSNSILILFAHVSYNDNLIKLFCNLKEEGVIFPNIIYREHPNVKLTVKQLQILQIICPDIVSITTILWHNLKFTNVLAMTSNSTSGIDALASGTSLLWLPFLTEHSLQFTIMMKELGCIANNKKEFTQFIRDFLNNPEFAIETERKCQLDYQTIIKQSN